MEDGKSNKALPYLNSFLRKQPDDIEGRKTRAQALAILGEYEASARDYSTVRQLDENVSPGIYLEQARVLHSAGQQFSSEAITVLDDGIRKFGDLPTLQLAAIEFLRDSRQWDYALERISILFDNADRKEQWYVLQGDVYSQSGQAAKARQSYKLGLAAIESLSPAKRNTRATQLLEKKLVKKLEIAE
jgi:tetratricopeptide (TPR) repeat protein